MSLSILGSHRDKGYHQALKTAERTLRPHQHFTVADCMDVAMRAMNAAGHFAKKGKIYLSHDPFVNQDVIVIRAGGKEIRSPHIDQLLLYVEANSAMDFLTQSSGIARTYNITENPY